MCGLTGFLEFEPHSSAGELYASVDSMASTLYRRGPDDAHSWADAAAGIALGFRRLAILDLTPTGRQPMCSATGRYVIVCNGEVYNFTDIRHELEQTGKCPELRGGSDTEVILACIEAWGLEAAVGRFVGMFAFALWDRQERVLHLVRDRIGVKPLYYGWAGSALVFGSELKALRAHSQFPANIDRDALALMMRYGYVPAPYSIYQGVFKLPAGSILTISANNRSELIPKTYWSVHEAARQGIAKPFTGSDAEAVDRLDAVLRNSVALRMIADVPLGVFLSGGIDSSVITALTQAQSSKPIKTFTIGFEEDSYNEARYALEVAAHLKTDHTDLILSAADTRAVIPELPELYDEPFADSSQIPTLIVSRLARQSVTVSLSGDGGDELFAGYVRHFAGRTIQRISNRVPAPIRKAVGRSIEARPKSWERMMAIGLGLAGGGALQRNPAEKLAKLALALRAESSEEMYSLLVAQWKSPESVVVGASQSESPYPAAPSNMKDPTDHMLYLDTLTYLPDDILVKVDRASMGVGLEARSPFLDHRVLEYAWQLPLSLKVRENEGKWILKQVLHRYVPQTMFDRPKAGFSIPIGEWLRGPLRDWAEDLLGETRLDQEGYLGPQPIRNAWNEHLNGSHNHSAKLWAVLMFQAWLANTQA